MTLPRFYPIAPDVSWIERIAPLGISAVQLRLKDAAPAEVSRQIAESLAICRRHGVTLIVNDYWREAIALGASDIHLGQEDLAAADLAAIRTAGIRYGVSTHDEHELAIALAARPDYVALGPIYETRLKAMIWAPQGLEKLSHWRALIADWARAAACPAPPLCAIGGLTPERAPGAFAAGAQSLAVITDYVTNPDPAARIATWLAVCAPPH